MLHENRQRAEVFGDDAEQYDRSRPRYPAAMIEHLVGSGRKRMRVLDVGCGTGIAARQFLQQGCVVLGVEADERMAAVARGHGLEVEISRFETWDDKGRRFDLLTGGQSWHWVDPYQGAIRAGDVLEPAGRVGLFWNAGRPPDDVQRAFDAVYESLTGRGDIDPMPIGNQDPERFGITAEGLRSSGKFAEPETASYVWDHYYSTDEWLDQLQTHSDHRLLPRPTIDALLRQLREVIASFGGGFTMSYKTWLITALRRS